MRRNAKKASRSTTAEYEQVSVRPPRGALEKAQHLVEVLRSQPGYAGLRLTRHGVLRMALSRGLDIIEAEATKGANGPR